jgi:hypothetical protein
MATTTTFTAIGLGFASATVATAGSRKRAKKHRTRVIIDCDTIRDESCRKAIRAARRYDGSINQSVAADNLSEDAEV